MAFFKLRKAGGEPAAPAPAPESVDALRKRARYRLAGAAILVLAGVIGFPLLFDNQPRPIAVDIPIDIPDKAKVRPLVVAPESASEALAASASTETAVPAAAPVAVASRAVAGQLDTASTKSPESKAPPKDAQKEEVIISPSKAAEKLAPAKPVEKLAAKPEAKVEAKPEVKPADKKSDKPADVTGRFVVQFGAFTDSAHAHEARLTVEKTGLKTYAQIAETPDGKKFRVRVGPFEKRSDAEKAAEKIKKTGLPAAILGL
jgi:DedD protein